MSKPAVAHDSASRVDKRELLADLKIDRSSSPPAQERSRWVAAGIVAILVMGALVVAYRWSQSSEPVQPVAAAVPAAAPAPTVPAAADASVLDATGYVVARRYSTVSAKVTGKVAELFLEEGMRVEAGQLLARLDDSIPRAALALAQSQADAARAGLEETAVQIRQAQLDLDRIASLAARNLMSKADLDRAQLSLEALRARLERARSDAVVAERSAAVQRLLLVGHGNSRAVRGCGGREGRATGRDDLADLRRRRLHANGHLHHRRHDVARSRSGRERGVHQPSEPQDNPFQSR